MAVDAMTYAGPPPIKHPANAQITDAIMPQLERLNRGANLSGLKG